MKLPEPLFFTIADEAYKAAEELHQVGFEIEIHKEENIYILGEKPCFTPSSSSSLLSSSY